MNDEDLFSHALELPQEQRDAYLDEACAGDAELRARVEKLLRSHESAGSFLAAPVPFDPEATLPLSEAERKAIAAGASEQEGDVLGLYKLREQIGEGGFGTVWVADQEKPVKRRVALKIIKLGMDTKDVIARFEQERQALAVMDHPNIAKVLDAGTTQFGRPFFVMELVRGIPITDYCDQNKLTTEERLVLFAKVCHAVQHAHQKGIIHRDIKPSNILVTLYDGVPVPKVIDFGIAKATEGSLTDATIYTQLHQLVGTPAYMSPEQAEMSGLDMDTRSDIYSLGVLLYELLAGRTPFDARELMASGIDAMRKTIREQDPPRPSNRLATLNDQDLTTTAKRRSTDKSHLLHQCRGDLDWIVMKCLEKDRTRRYETANGLAADITRHLANEPVTARPPSAAYRLQKSWRRNKIAYTAGAVVTLALLVGLVASIFAMIGESRTREARARAESTADVVRGMLADAVPELFRQDNRTGVRVLLDSADRMVSEHLQQSPIAEFTVRKDISDLYYRVGNWELDQASRQIQRMETLLPQLTDEELPPPDRLEFQMLAAGIHAATDDFEGGKLALQGMRKQLESEDPSPRDLIVETLIVESDAHFLHGEIDSAEELLRQAMNINPDQQGRINFTKESPRERLANILIQADKFAEAAQHARTALELVPKDQRNVILELSGRLVQALCGIGSDASFKEAEHFVDDHEHEAASREAGERKRWFIMRAHVYLAQGRWDEGEAILIKIGSQDDAGSGEWRLGALAAKAQGNAETYARFVQMGLEKFRSTADTQSSYCLLEVLALQSQPPEINAIEEDLIRQLQNTSRGWWSVSTPLIQARRSLYDGRPQDALDYVDRFVHQDHLFGVAAMVHRQLLKDHRHQFIRAVALAELGRNEEAREAFMLCWNHSLSNTPTGAETRASVGKYLSVRTSRLWAASILAAKGIELPEEAVRP